MGLRKKDKVLLKTEKCMKRRDNAWQFMVEFSNKGQTKNSINKVLLTLEKNNVFNRCPGSDRQRTARTDEKVEFVESLHGAEST